MSDQQREPPATGAREQAEVERLAAAGGSVREIAKEVFGDVRYRGRVERILRGPRDPAGEAWEPLDLDSLPTLETRAVLRKVMNGYLHRIERGELRPSIGEALKLLDLDRRLTTLEQLERANALTRTSRGT